MNIIPSLKNLVGSGVVSISLIAATVSQAQSTWSGAATPDANISNAGNWDVAPTSGAGNTLNFAGSVNLSPNNDITLTSADQAINFNIGASTFTITGNAIRSGNIANNSGVVQNIMPSLRLNGGRTFNVGSGGLFLGQPVGSTSTSARSVTKTGNGDLTVTGGTAASGGSSYSVSAGALIFSNSVSQTTSLGSGSPGISLTASGTSLRLINGGTLNVGGALSTVSGSSVTLNNSGATTITGGSTIAAGASFTGKGTLGGGLVSVSGDVAPGISDIGTISVASLTFASGSSITMELDRSAGQKSDLLSASGALTYGGTLNLLNIGGALQSGDTFNLFDGTLGGTFSLTNTPSLDPSLAWDWSQFSSQGIVSITSVPEPTTVALLGVGTSLAIWQRRRRKI